MDLEADFERMVREHQHGMFVFALGLTGSRAEADDVAQEAFVRAYRALRTWDRERIATLSERPWLRRICLNTWRNRVRAASRRPGGELPDAVVDPSPGPEARALASASRTEVWRAIAGLPEGQRVAVTLRWLDDLSYAEAAGVMGIPVGTVKSHVSRGLSTLRQALAGREVA